VLADRRVIDWVGIRMADRTNGDTDVVVMLAKTGAKASRKRIIAGVLQTPMAAYAAVAGVIVGPVRSANKWVTPIAARVTQVAFSIHAGAVAVHSMFVTVWENAALRRRAARETTMTIVTTVVVTIVSFRINCKKQQECHDRNMNRSDI